MPYLPVLLWRTVMGWPIPLMQLGSFEKSIKDLKDRSHSRLSSHTCLSWSSLLHRNGSQKARSKKGDGQASASSRAGESQSARIWPEEHRGKFGWDLFGIMLGGNICLNLNLWLEEIFGGYHFWSIYETKVSFQSAFLFLFFFFEI